ncbi:XkdX family protein [Carnobacterium divergens]|uniref:XkdX family protein n=1 Tax=Carnobacterium divergens TaxID=2748 RepID=UPI0007F454C3|nr:XkdX family protein [Carnobacterium divergens]SBO17416.1 conserved hypothetical protein [Carnobacterium divergens]
MYKSLKEKYLKGWVTEKQLAHYVDLKKITATQMQEIMKAKDAKDKEEAIEI